MSTAYSRPPCPVCMLRGPCAHRDDAGVTPTDQNRSDDYVWPDEPPEDDLEPPIDLSQRRRDRRGEPTGRRSVQLASAAAIRPKRARWLWDRKIPLGELTLLAGREGIGKSTVAYALVADVTRGRMRGESLSTPRNVVIAATEDSWEHTIVPRLLGAGADLDRVFRIEVTDGAGLESTLSLPVDVEATEEVLREYRVALLVLDPLLSRLSSALDTHKDSEVRQGLEPLVRIAQRTGTSILGLIHVSKASTKDPLTSVMGSRAFAAVARSVLFAMSDPEDRTTTLLGLAKSNLGPTNLPTMTFTIQERVVAQDNEDGSDISIGCVEWGPEREESVREVMEQDSGSPETRSATQDAKAWLHDHLVSQGGKDDASDIRRKGVAQGHTTDVLRRAKEQLKLITEHDGFPRRTWWALPT